MHTISFSIALNLRCQSPGLDDLSNARVCSAMYSDAARVAQIAANLVEALLVVET